MSTDKKPEDQITEAGAVELDETQLDGAAGGLLPAAPAIAPRPVADPTAPSPTSYEAWPQKYRG